MKENEFLDGVSNIEPDVVERFVTMDNKLQSRSKRSRNIWLRVLALAACVALVIGVIATVVLLQGGETGQDIPTEPNEDDRVIYTIYADSSLGVSSSIEGISEQVSIKSATEKTFTFSKKTKTERHSSAVDNYEFTVAGQTYTIPFVESYETAADSSEKVRRYMQYNRYLSVETGILLETNIETKEVEMFSNPGQLRNNWEGDLTEAEAKEKAIAVITELYGADTFDEYKYKHTLVSTYNSSDKQDGYSVTYQRYVFGIPTDDDISVKFNMSGEVLAINARGKGKLANAEKDITKEQIDNAIKVVNEQFSDKWSVHAPSIVIDSEGDYYVRIGISRNVNGQVTAMQLYINVQ